MDGLCATTCFGQFSAMALVLLVNFIPKMCPFRKPSASLDQLGCLGCLGCHAETRLLPMYPEHSQHT